MYKIRGADGKEYGPADAGQMRAWLAENRINAHTLVQVEGTSTWQPLSSLPEFAGEAGAAPAPAPMAASYTPVDTRELALSKVKGPAIALMVVGIVCGVWSLLGLLLNTIGAGMQGMRSSGNPDIDRWIRLSSGGIGIIQGQNICITIG